jgi:hypothetical protein
MTIDAAERLAQMKIDCDSGEQTPIDADKKARDSKATRSLINNVKQVQEGLVQLAKTIDDRRAVGVKKIRDAEGKLVAAQIKRGDGSVEDVHIQ